MIHVMIERSIADGMLSTYEELAARAMQRTYIAPGFIAGESFFDANDPHRRFLLCKWRTARDWQRWAHSSKRLELVSQIAPILTEPERVVVLEH